MKFRILAILGICLAAHISVSASVPTINEPEFEGNTVLISGTGEKVDDILTVKILPEDSDEGTFADAVLVKEIKCGENAVFNFSFVMLDTKNAEDTSGEYKIYVNFGNGGIVQRSFNFENAISRGAIIGAIKENNGVAQLSGLKGLLEDTENANKLRAAGIKLDIFNTLGEKKDRCLTLLLTESDLSAMNEDELRNAVNKAIYITKLENCSIPEAEKCLSGLNPDFKGTHYSEINNEKQKNWITEYLANKSFDNYASYEQAYEEANALYLVNYARYGELNNIIAENDSIFHLLSDAAYSKYVQMNSTMQRKVNEEVVISLSSENGKLYDVGAFVELYKNKINAIFAQSQSNSGAGGSGGGSGGASFTFPATSGNTSSVTPASDSYFSDLTGYEWAKEAIGTLKDRGIVSGYPDGSYMPSKEVKREEFVKMLISALGSIGIAGSSGFDDVSADAWYAPYVTEAVDNGIVSGLGDGNFGIGHSISRQQMAVMVYRAIHNKNFSKIREYEGFSDEESIADYAKEAIGHLYSIGKINGVGENKFAPEKSLTRAEAAKIICDIFCQ